MDHSFSFRCKSALLALHFEPNFIAAGGFDKRLYMVDPRAPDDFILKRYHTQPILSIAADDKYVITGSEDKVISIYDRVAGKNYKRIQVLEFGFCIYALLLPKYYTNRPCPKQYEP